MFTAEDKDDDVAQMFVDSLEEKIREKYNRFKRLKDMIFTKDDVKSYNAATTCHICGGKLGKDDKVRDHFHLRVRFRGAAQNVCNLNNNLPKFSSVVFHNLTGYDSHLFVKKLKGEMSEKINCIPCNEEKYISFSTEIVFGKFINCEGREIIVKRELRFIYSFRFMPSSLEALSKNLSKDQCKNLGAFFKDQQKLNNYIPATCERSMSIPFDRLNETELPPKSAFYSKLNDSGISDEDYEQRSNCM